MTTVFVPQPAGPHEVLSHRVLDAAGVRVSQSFAPDERQLARAALQSLRQRGGDPVDELYVDTELVAPLQEAGRLVLADEEAAALLTLLELEQLSQEQDSDLTVAAPLLWWRITAAWAGDPSLAYSRPPIAHHLSLLAVLTRCCYSLQRSVTVHR